MKILRNALCLLTFLFALTSTVCATDINVAAINIPNWRAGGATCSMRLYASGNFTDSAGIRYIGGSVGTANFFQTVEGTVSGTVCTLNSFTLPSTTDAIANNQVRYTAVLYDSKNTQRGVYLNSFALPVSLGTNVTWAQITIQNQTAQRQQTPGYYNAPQVDALVAQQIGNIVLPDAGVITKGKSALTVAPVNPLLPIAVGANDPLVLAQVQTRYADSYASLSAAVSQIGGAKTKLVISSAETASSDFTIPRNITVDFEAGGAINPNASVTVTILSMKDPGSNKVFGGAGNVVVGQNAAIKHNLYWWTGQDDSQDATKPIANLMLSIASSGGGEALIPVGMWKTNSTILVPSSTIITGAGTRFSGFVLTAKAKPLMKIESIPNQNVGDINIRNLTLNASFGDAGSAGILLTGVVPDSVVNVHLDDLRIIGGEIGVDVFAQNGGTWEMQHLNINRCQFIIQTENSFRVNTINSDVHFEAPLFLIPAGKIGINVNSVGSLSVKNYNAFGSAPPTPGVPPTDNSTFIYLFGARNNILLEGGQDEHLEYYMRSSTNADLKAVLTVRGNLIQSKFKASANMNLQMSDNFAIHGAGSLALFQNDPGVAFSVYSYNDSFLGLGGPPGVTIPPENFTGNASRIARREDINTITSKFGQFVEVRPGLSLFNTEHSITPAFTNSKQPALSLMGDNTGLPLLELVDRSGADTYGYHFFRDSSGTFQLGWLVAAGNQTGFRGMYFDFPVKIQGDTAATLTASQTLTNKTFLSPILTGTPTAPTAVVTNNTTQLATTAFVRSLMPSAVATLDFPSIAPGTTSELTITVTNISLGDVAHASPLTSIENGLIWSVYVSEADVITIRLANITGNAIDPVSKSWRAWGLR